jgi:hypothetical protein
MMTPQRYIELACVIITCASIAVSHAMDTEGRISKLEAYQSTVIESNRQLEVAVKDLTASVNKLQGHLNY